MIRHHIRKFMTERRIDGTKQTVFAFSCNPCGISAKEHTSKSARDRAAKAHEDNRA